MEAKPITPINFLQKLNRNDGPSVNTELEFKGREYRVREYCTGVDEGYVWVVDNVRRWPFKVPVTWLELVATNAENMKKGGPE